MPYPTFLTPHALALATEGNVAAVTPNEVPITNTLGLVANYVPRDLLPTPGDMAIVLNHVSSTRLREMDDRVLFSSSPQNRAARAWIHLSKGELRDRGWNLVEVRTPSLWKPLEEPLVRGIIEYVGDTHPEHTLPDEATLLSIGELAMRLQPYRDPITITRPTRTR